MSVRNVKHEPRKSRVGREGVRASPHADASGEPEERYRRLPTGTHGLDPAEVQSDQRQRLRTAMVELIARRGYPAVRILDVTKLARVSRPTFYSLYSDKEALFLDAYEDISGRAARQVIKAYGAEVPRDRRDEEAIRSVCVLAAAEPEAMSLWALGAFGAGAKALERRNEIAERLERVICSSRDPTWSERTTDLTAKVLIGGVRDVLIPYLRTGRSSELLQVADELAAWASSYPLKLPAGLQSVEPASGQKPDVVPALISERARRAEGPLRSGRHTLSRKLVMKNQRERIVDATAATVAAKGLAGLTIPQIARRANVSHQTFYEIYSSKHDAFLGALKVGMHEALLVTGEAYDARRDDWPSAVAAGLRALIDYVVSEPAHAHLSLVDTFGASPEAIEIRGAALESFSAYLSRGYRLAPKHVKVPTITAAAIAGGLWQVFHDYVDSGRIAELPGLAPQVSYLALVPFLGPERAARVAGQPDGGDSAPRSARRHTGAPRSRAKGDTRASSRSTPPQASSGTH